MSTEQNNGTPEIVPDVPATDGPDVTPTAIPLRWVKVSHKDPSHIASRYPYAAYGSNLSFEQMVRRCPTSDIFGHGLLRNAKLVFAYYLGIVESEGASTPVAVFKMTAADVAAMDRCEGLGRSYERYLVTVEVNGSAVRCFTYVKRDNALEEPSERYYQTCLKGYTDWNFDTRRLRHAREDARKNGKRRTYSSNYGYWSGDTTGGFDWDSYRRGSRNNSTTTSSPRLPFVPSVKSHDDMTGDMGATFEPVDESRAPRTHDKRTHNLVTGRPRSDARRGIKHEHVDPTRVSTLNGSGEEVFTNGKGERWRKGKNGVWYRAKE